VQDLIVSQSVPAHLFAKDLWPIVKFRLFLPFIPPQLNFFGRRGGPGSPKRTFGSLGSCIDSRNLRFQTWRAAVSLFRFTFLCIVDLAISHSAFSSNGSRLFLFLTSPLGIAPVFPFSGGFSVFRPIWPLPFFSHPAPNSFSSTRSCSASCINLPLSIEGVERTPSLPHFSSHCPSFRFVS